MTPPVLHKILVVDDDQRLRDLLRRYLTEQGFNVFLAENATAMNKLWTRERFDLVVLDLMLPGEDGLTICRKLRGTGDTTPVIMLTARGDEVDRIIGLELGADDYLPKPFNPRELVARIHAVLRRRGAPEASGAPSADVENFVFGPYQLNLQTRTLTKDGQSKLLTTGEFAVMKAFARHPRQPLSREKLMELARGREYEVFDRSLDVQISRLRKLIEADPSSPRYIQTVWGLGYVFIPDGPPDEGAAAPVPPAPAADAPAGLTGRVRAMPGGVFWRTFLLLVLLIGASLAAWYQSFRIFERTPRAQQIAQTIVSVVNVTRSALIHSDTAKRADLLADLANNESIRIYPLETADVVEPLRDTPSNKLMVDFVRARLGRETRIERGVNGIEGLWVSFSIEDDDYWVAFERDRLEAVAGLQWLGWGAAALALSLIGAVAMSRLINLPLKRLATAALVVGEGGRPAPLPEKGPREIRDANASFNAMVDDLARIEADRVLLLAGISHDLRTPLTRLRLEAEMSVGNDDARQAIQADVDQMDAIINQFLDYARPLDAGRASEEIDLAALVGETVGALGDDPSLRIATDLKPTARIVANRTEIQRVLFNLVENARRYGRTPGTDVAELTIATHDQPPRLEVADRGVGIPPDAIKRMRQPFTRLETARTEANGAGLGLAIVDRIAQRHRARFELETRDGGGLVARVVFARGPR